MFKIVLLICPMYLDAAHCDLSNALDVSRGPRVASSHQCGFFGQTMMARTALVSDPRKQYLKIMCVRDQLAGR